MNDTINSKIFTSDVQLLMNSDAIDVIFASKNLNPLLTYVRFILTDDKPNANGVRIPREEFSNLITTGIYMPIKMAVGEISEGHAGAVPLGVITHLREDGDKIRGIAALWNKERPADISHIKERYANGDPLDLSWEIGYEDSSIDDDGILNLSGCVLRATTLVGMPAYGGRTGITDVELSEEKSKEEKNVEKDLQTLQTEISDLKDQVKVLEENQLTDEDKQKLAQYDDLVSFKEQVEAEAARLETLEEIQNAFKDAGVEKDEAYFTENEETLLALKETNTLDFFISQLKIVKEDTNVEDLVEEEDDTDLDEEASVKIPDIKHEKQEKLTTTEIAKALRQSKKAKDS